MLFDTANQYCHDSNVLKALNQIACSSVYVIFTVTVMQKYKLDNH